MTADGECVCGLDYVRGYWEDEARHAEMHEEYARGPRLPLVARLPSVPAEGMAAYRLVWIDARLPQPLRSEAARIAYIECSEMHRPVCYDGSETSEHPRLLLAMHGDRSVGFLMIGDGEVHWRLRWGVSGVEALSTDRTSASNPGVGRVWIAADHRQQGLASAMVSHAASREAIAPCDFVWTIPLTEGGKRLVGRFCPDVWLADGELEDLRELLREG